MKWSLPIALPGGKLLRSRDCSVPVLRAWWAATRRVCPFLSCLLFFFVSNAGAANPDLKELEIDHALTFDFPTPHTKWAKPYAGGKIRVLFFSDGTGTNPRECVELMQRFDIDAKAVFWAQITDSKESHWHGGGLGERRMLDLLRQKWDCFVFLGLPLTRVPAEQEKLILNAVAKGAGILFVGTDDKGSLQGKKRILPLPAFVSDDNVNEAYSVGKGRAIGLLSQPKIDYHEGWEIEYDYWQESLGRALLWSAGKEPATRLTLNLTCAGQLSGTKIILAAGKAGRLQARISGKPRAEDLRIQVSLRKPGHEEVVLPQRDIAPGQDATLILPKLSAGSWHADARVIGAAGVESWSSIPFEVRSERAITGLLLKKGWSEPGGVISGRVFVSGARLPKEVLRVQLLDRRRRVLARKDLSVWDEKTEFAFDMPDWLPMLVTVEARLLSSGQEMSRAYKYFHVTKRKQDRFNFLIWGVPRGTLAPYAEESLARQGVTLQLDWENPAAYVGAYDISWVPYTTHISVEKTAGGVMQPFCWNDLLSVQKHASTLVSIHRGSREHGAFVYSLGDENKTLGSCLSPYCATAYRDFLQESYGSLAALNKSWQTGFASWKDVGLAQAGDDDELSSRAAGNYPRWFDRQAYKSWNYVHFCLRYSKAYKALDPQAKTGFDGSAGFATGDDLDLIIRSLDSWVPYQGLTEEVIRSVAPRSFVRSTWLGGRYKTADPLLYNYWRQVTLGADSVWWWMWSCIGDLHGFLAPDLRPFPEIAEVVKDTRIVRDGLGDLLLHSIQQDDGIAILYSYPSVFAHKLEAGGSFGAFEEAHGALVKAIRDRGLQFRYVTDRMLRQGEVDLSKYKILFLPRSEALGDREARAVRSFVEKGGTVVADFRPGLYDEHCKRRARGVLDDLFGIKRGASVPARTLTLGKSGAGQKTLADGGLILNGARAGRLIDGVPVWLSHGVGKGRAVLLNFQMNSLSALDPAGVPWERYLGSEPVYRVTGADGKKAVQVEVTRWLDGGSEIVSLLRKDGAQEDLTVSLPGTQQVYDLRSRKTYGPCRSFTTTLLPNRASFFVLADKPAPALKIALDRPELLPGMTAKVEVSVPGAEGMHAVKLGVQAGERHLDWHDGTFLVGSKPVTVEIPVAYNDPRGEYRIVFKDLFTGAAFSAGLSVRAALPVAARKVN